MFYIELHPLKVQPPEQQCCPELALPPHLFVKIEHKMSTYHISQLFSNWTQRKLCFHDVFIRCTQAFTILRKKNKSQNKKLCSFPLLWSTDTLHTTCNLLLIDIIAYIKGGKKKEKKSTNIILCKLLNCSNKTQKRFTISLKCKQIIQRFFIIKSKFKPIILNDSPYYDWLLLSLICRIVILHFKVLVPWKGLLLQSGHITVWI